MPFEDLQTWSDPWQALWQDLLALAPRVLSALVLLTAGLCLALLAKALVQRLLARMGADQAFSGLFIFRVWSLRHPGQTPSRSLGLALAYGVFLAFSLASARLAGGTFGQELFNGLMHAAPRLFIVLLIMLLGILLASGAGLLTQIVLSGSGSLHAAFWGRLSSWAVFTASALFALEPLGLAGQLLGQAILVLLAGGALALGLAFGLGCKDLARELVIDLLKPDNPGK